MIDKIIGYSVQNKVGTGIAIFFLILWGIYSATQLPLDAVPDITDNQVQVITASPDLAAQEVERLITFPLETALNATAWFSKHQVCLPLRLECHYGRL